MTENTPAQTPLVGIIMGSKSDLSVMEGCAAELERLGVPYELVVASAHMTENTPAQTPLVGIIMGSKSDLSVMEGCAAELERLGVPYELVVASAHRNPAKVHEWAESAADRGIRVIVAAAGKAAHLGGVVAAFTPLPVIG